MGKTAVHEVLASIESTQWRKEFSTIQKARAHDLGGKADVEFQKILDANFRHYEKVTDELAVIGAEDVQKAATRLDAIDTEECRKRLAEDGTLEKWKKFIALNTAKYGKDSDFELAAHLCEKAAELKDDPRMVQKYLDQARWVLDKSESAEKIPAKDLPFVPSAPRNNRTLDASKVAAALKREDLKKHIARNDTWGDFDVQKALGAKATEQDLKVLWNILEAAVKAEEEEAAWKEYEEKAQLAAQARQGRKGGAVTGDAKKIEIYKELILGAGASASYYIANNYANLDLAETLVLGTLQPWAEERGKGGKVNHPHNMIDPEQDDEPVDEYGSLADRAEFSKRIAAVIKRVANVDASVGKVTRCKGDFFEVETSKGIYYARKITNALGIGKQKDPGEKKKGEPDPIESKESVKDMDTFKRAVDGKSIREGYAGKTINSIAVVGGNAAIDVATTILRDKDVGDLQIHWIVGFTGKPAFLRGTDNALAEKAFPKEELKEAPVVNGNMTVYKGRFKSAKGAGPVVVEIEGNAVKSITVDLVVYGSGPDVEAMQAMFVDEVDDTGKGTEAPMALEPVVDQDRHYNQQIEERDPAELMKKLGGKVSREKGKAEELAKILGDPSMKDVKGNPDDVMIGVKTKDGQTAQSSMQFMGASAARLKTQPVPGTGKQPKGLSPTGREGLHEAVATLPENVVGNDQLAASRSRIEAQLNALPTDMDNVPLVAKPGGVNFITANQTVIRTHIAECYPNIPPGLGDYLTGQVIHARSLRPKRGDTTKTPIPIPKEGDDKFVDMDLSQQAEFQKKWTERLGKINGELLTK
ncbi:MAG: hypothetical protein K8R60_03140 [Burkholderiales bacterium]|nr:hypothetical protein [Burkholderiales bacterium]